MSERFENELPEGEELLELVTLTDEEGEAMDFIILATVEYEGDNYDVLIADGSEDEEEGEVIILKKIDESGDDVDYDVVEDEAILDAVFELFKAEFDEIEE